jgi:phosphatidylglycerol:prolipoprotein diacylglycerol transferase
MYPLIRLFGNPHDGYLITIHTYKVMLILGVLIGLAYAIYIIKRLGESEERMIYMTLLSVFFGIIGSRVLYVLYKFNHFIEHPHRILEVGGGGAVFYGGFAAGLLAAIYYMKRYKLNIRKYLDVIAPASILGQGIGRLGCFSAGCCYGKPTSLPWGVVYPAELRGLTLIPERYLGVVHLHPTQLYSALGNIVIVLVLTYMLLRKRGFDGEVFAYGLILHSGFYFSMGFLRDASSQAPSFGPLAVTQIIYIAALMLGLYLLFKFKDLSQKG